jgi:hypothetical protein
MAKVKVRYKGASDVRILPADQLKERGVKGVTEDLVFSPGNLWAQEVEMSDELEAILRADGAFVIQPVADDGGTTVTDSADPLETSVDAVDDTGNKVVMDETGQTEENKHPLEAEAEAVGEAEKMEDEKAPLSSETGSTAGPDTNVATGSRKR